MLLTLGRLLDDKGRYFNYITLKLVHKTIAKPVDADLFFVSARCFHHPAYRRTAKLTRNKTTTLSSTFELIFFN
jgi:hypothetical protein